MDLNGKVVVVTGGVQGLGLAMAEKLASKGARIAIVDLNAEPLDAAVEKCKAAGGEARGYAANTASEEDVVKLFDDVVEDFGTLHGVICNAGITRDGLLIKAKDGVVQSKMTLAQWQPVIDVNLTGVFLCAREAAERMVNLGTEGVILNISSISQSGNMGQTNYSATKAGVSAMTVTWAKELARYGIRCAAIAPGFTETPMVMSMKPEALEKMAAGIPLKRLGKPEEIAHTALYIFENDYFTGRVIEMDGGIRI
jgi:3-oxoacyl-[acyl-carrier protein] reductase